MDDRGFVMVVLLIGMAVMAVWMTALLPTWRHQATREKEEELIFRGRQYARALALYQAKFGTLPTSVDMLVTGKFLRKKWKDPVTNDDFRIVTGIQTQTGPAGQPVGGAPQRGGPVGGGTPAAGGPARGTPQPTGPGGGQASPFQSQQSPIGGGGISGVASKSTSTSIKIYENQQRYDQWPFTVQSARARGVGGSARGGQPARGAPGATGPAGRPGGTPGGVQRPGGNRGEPGARPGGPPAPGRGAPGSAPIRRGGGGAS